MLEKNGKRNKSIRFAAVVMTIALLGGLIGCSATPESKSESLPGTENSAVTSTESLPITENVAEVSTQNVLAGATDNAAEVSTENVLAGSTENAAEASTENVTVGAAVEAADTSETYEQIIDILDKSRHLVEEHFCASDGSLVPCEYGYAISAQGI